MSGLVRKANGLIGVFANDFSWNKTYDGGLEVMIDHRLVREHLTQPAARHSSLFG
jgi:hypothetical protein